MAVRPPGVLAGTLGTLAPLETVLNLGAPAEGRYGPILMEHAKPALPWQ